MRKLLLTVLVLAAAVLVTGAAQADESFTGEIIDKACFDKGMHGADHADCAKSCFSRGATMGLLTADGEVIILRAVEDNQVPFDALKELAGMNAKVTGLVTEEDGMKVVMVTASEKAN